MLPVRSFRPVPKADLWIFSERLFHPSAIAAGEQFVVSEHLPPTFQVPRGE
jgi:hypothetical protein